MADFAFSFPDSDLQEANRLAEELEARFQDEAPGAEVARARTDPTNMDAGAIVEVILAGAAVREVARGISDFMNRSGAKVLITRRSPNGVEDKYLAEGRVGEGLNQGAADFLEATRN